MWGEPDPHTKVKPGRALPNPAAVERMRELEAAAATPHSPKRKAFYNSGLSADVDVPVALAASQQSDSFL